MFNRPIFASRFPFATTAFVSSLVVTVGMGCASTSETKTERSSPTTAAEQSTNDESSGEVATGAPVADSMSDAAKADPDGKREDAKSDGVGKAEGGLGQARPVVMGPLDKEIIRRVVKEHMAQIKNCYELELTRSPGLDGKLVIKWVIDGQGTVSRATVASTTMKNKQVESCIASSIRTWRFPKAKEGGGIVLVNYPFVFKKIE